VGGAARHIGAQGLVKQLKILKHYAYFPAEQRYLPAAEMQNIESQYFRFFSVIRHNLGIHTFHQRALATADTAYKVTKLTFSKGEIHILEHNTLCAGNIDFTIIYNFFHSVSCLYRKPLSPSYYHCKPQRFLPNANLLHIIDSAKFYSDKKARIHTLCIRVSGDMLN